MLTLVIDAKIAKLNTSFLIYYFLAKNILSYNDFLNYNSNI